MRITEIKTKEEATQKAIDWQHWASEVSLSYSDLFLWSNYFENLGNRFNLIDEFQENGII